LFFHNNFLNNGQQATRGGVNIWDEGYPSGGNYWSDYTGNDTYSGINQNETGSDNIGDLPYVIDANNRDNYPLMNPWVPYENGTIYIRDDGSVDPSGAPILRKGNLYTLTSNITSDNDGIVTERSDMILDGAGYTLQGPGNGIGIHSSGREDVMVRNTQIKTFDFGIWLDSSSNNSIIGNNITANNWCGIELYISSNNSICGNNIANGVDGICLDSSSNNSIIGNTFFNDGLTALDSYENVVLDNSVNGRRLVYLEGVSDYAVNDAGQVILVNCNNIFVENLNPSNTTIGVQLWGTNNTKISDINITNNYAGICLDYSSNNIIKGSNIATNNEFGILFYSSSNNSIIGNNITANNVDGVWLSYFSNYNSIMGNNITANNWNGIELASLSDHNSIMGNNITANNDCGVWLFGCSDNFIYHNNFIDNTQQLYIGGSGYNFWDDGYPSGGNYWSDHIGTDICHGPYQNETGCDGIGDLPYVIDANNIDDYPLMKPYVGSHDVGIIGVNVSKTVVGEGLSMNFTVKVLNYGEQAETFNITIITNSTAVQTQEVNLAIRTSETIIFTWNTTGFAKGNYTIIAYATVVEGELNTVNNNFTDGTVLVSIVGDVNGDGRVRVDDVLAVALGFGSNFGEPRYNANFDINGDLKIRIDDVLAAAQHFGQGA
jgi:parallel beta-helix repeat protein